MSRDLTPELIAEDLSIAAEVGSEWDYSFDGSNIVAKHYNEAGDFDRTLVLHITFEDK